MHGILIVSQTTTPTTSVAPPGKMTNEDITMVSYYSEENVYTKITAGTKKDYNYWDQMCSGEQPALNKQLLLQN